MPLSASRIGSVTERPTGSTNWFTRLEALLGRIWRCLSQWGIREQTNLHHGQLITHYWGSRVPFPSDQFSLAAIQNASACHFCRFLWNCAITLLFLPWQVNTSVRHETTHTYFCITHCCSSFLDLKCTYLWMLFALLYWTISVSLFILLQLKHIFILFLLLCI